MAITVREKIKGIVRSHLTDQQGQAFGQCLTAVGWVGGTLPELYEADGMVELSMADVAGGGIVVGSGLAGRRPIYIIRYQGFNWFNAPIIANYACKSKEIWQTPCPIFIRSISMEGGIGPVASSSHHSLFYRMPGVVICSPMTPNEYEKAYRSFMSNDDVYYISEHRGSYANSDELPDIIYENPDFVLLPISITRFAAQQASIELRKQGFKVSVFHQFWIKPHRISDDTLKNVQSSKFGALVSDDDYVDGIARAYAHKISLATYKNIDVIGLEDRSAGFYPSVDNLPPDKVKLMEFILSKVT